METRLPGQATPTAIAVRRSWRFFLEWVPGGEENLRDDWMQFMSPWWEPALFKLPESSSMLKLWPDIANPKPNLRNSPSLLPNYLVAPFSNISTAAGTFPTGYYCKTCGRINVQRFLRHRICEGTTCLSRIDPDRETGWAINVSNIVWDRKASSARIVPDDIWTDPTTLESVTAFGDGTYVYHYFLAAVPSAASLDLHSGAGADTHGCFVHHVFNGNSASLQAGASSLFEIVQQDVRIERKMSVAVFTTPLIESGSDAVLGRRGHSIWNQHTVFIEGALDMYCREIGPLKVRAWRVHAWSSGGNVRIPIPRGQTAAEDAASIPPQHIQTFYPRTKPLVLLCFGADITLLSAPLAPNGETNDKATEESLRVTMVHGDIIVLSGDKFEASNINIYRRVRACTDILLRLQWSLPAFVCVSGSIFTTPFLLTASIKY